MPADYTLPSRYICMNTERRFPAQRAWFFPPSYQARGPSLSTTGTCQSMRVWIVLFATERNMFGIFLSWFGFLRWGPLLVLLCKCLHVLTLLQCAQWDTWAFQFSYGEKTTQMLGKIPKEHIARVWDVHPFGMTHGHWPQTTTATAQLSRSFSRPSRCIGTAVGLWSLKRMHSLHSHPYWCHRVLVN